MVELPDILKFLEKQTGADKVPETSNIGDDLGVDGDDFDELVSEFSKQFNVDISACLWYFHSGDEGSWNSIGGAFFKSPNKRVNYIPITPLMLLEFARKGKWDLQYPEHKLPSRRYDIIINWFIVIAIIAVLMYKCAT